MWKIIPSDRCTLFSYFVIDSITLLLNEFSDILALWFAYHFFSLLVEFCILIYIQLRKGTTSNRTVTGWGAQEYVVYAIAIAINVHCQTTKLSSAKRYMFVNVEVKKKIVAMQKADWNCAKTLHQCLRDLRMRYEVQWKIKIDDHRLIWSFNYAMHQLLTEICCRVDKSVS